MMLPSTAFSVTALLNASVFNPDVSKRSAMLNTPLSLLTTTPYISQLQRESVKDDKNSDASDSVNRSPTQRTFDKNLNVGASTVRSTGGELHQLQKRPGHPYQSRAPPRHKKPRTSFTKAQVAFLENRFIEQKYLASAERVSLAHQLCMSDAQVKTWFQNRRTKWRRQEAEEREYANKTTNRLLSMSSQFFYQS